MWARIYLIPALQAEEDRDQVRRYLADKAREKELLGTETKVYHSDRYVTWNNPALTRWLANHLITDLSDLHLRLHPSMRPSRNDAWYRECTYMQRDTASKRLQWLHHSAYPFRMKTFFVSNACCKVNSHILGQRASLVDTTVAREASILTEPGVCRPVYYSLDCNKRSYHGSGALQFVGCTTTRKTIASPNYPYETHRKLPCASPLIFCTHQPLAQLLLSYPVSISTTLASLRYPSTHH